MNQKNVKTIKRTCIQDDKPSENNNLVTQSLYGRNEELLTDLVCNLDEKAESLAGAQVEPLGDVLAEVLGPC